MSIQLVIFINCLAISLAIPCPNHGKMKQFIFFSLHFFNQLKTHIVNEKNVTDLIQDDKFSNWNRPVLDYNSPVNVNVIVEMIRIIKVVSKKLTNLR